MNDLQEDQSNWTLARMINISTINVGGQHRRYRSVERMSNSVVMEKESRREGRREMGRTCHLNFS